MVDYLKKALIYGHTSRISSWIYYQFTTFKGKNLDMPPKSYKPQYQYSIERINKIWIRHRQGVSLSHSRENRDAAFYTLMLRNRSKKSLATSGFAGVFLPEVRIYTYPRQNGVLLRNIPTAKGVLKLRQLFKWTPTEPVRYWKTRHRATRYWIFRYRVIRRRKIQCN